MYNTLIRNIIRFLSLVLVQILVFDNIRFGNYIHPYVYVLFIMILPFDIPHGRLLIYAFLVGIIVDIFSGTPGLNASASVFMAFVRPYIIGITTRKSDIEDKKEPTVTEMGLQWFFVYGILLLLVHNFVFFFMEAFSIKLLGVVVIETLLSAPISFLIIILIIYIFKPIKKL